MSRAECRVSALSRQLQPATRPVDRSCITAQKCNATAAAAIRPPVVRPPPTFAANPVPFLMQSKHAHPDMFTVQRARGRYVVISDPSLFEDVLTLEDVFGNPQTPNMSVNKIVFQIPQATLDSHEKIIIKKLRRFLLHHCEDIADDIGHKVKRYLSDNLGDKGVMDLREIGAAVFWPMTEALFGSAASKRDAPHLLSAFDQIDGKFGKALRGNPVPEVIDGVTQASKVFEKSVLDARAGKCPMAPMLKFYNDELGGEEADPQTTAKFATAAWWGGQGNTLPSTVWTFGMLLSDSKWKKRAYDEVDREFGAQPGPSGKFDFEKLEFITAALKETLRLKTYSIAWRVVQKDITMTAKSGQSYLLKKGELIGLHFCMQHMDHTIYPDPKEFRPTRFLGSGERDRRVHPYAWAPFSAGFHKCSGYALAMIEIPVVLALVLREYDMELIDPLPGMDYKSSFGVVGPSAEPVRVRYKRRT